MLLRPDGTSYHTYAVDVHVQMAPAAVNWWQVDWCAGLICYGEGRLEGAIKMFYDLLLFGQRCSGNAAC